MSEPIVDNQPSACKVCSKTVLDNGQGVVVHVDGGMMEQRCKNCQWTGGQYGGYTSCPRCGDGTSLVNDHIAV